MNMNLLPFLSVIVEKFKHCSSYVDAILRVYQACRRISSISRKCLVTRHRYDRKPRLQIGKDKRSIKWLINKNYETFQGAVSVFKYVAHKDSLEVFYD